MTPDQLFESIIPNIKPKDFSIPNRRPKNSHFPDYLKDLLDQFSSFYSSSLVSIVDDVIPFEGRAKNVVIDKIKNLNSAINSTVDLYYKGKVAEASNHFFESLDELLFNEIKSIVILPKKSSFYRCRADNSDQFNRQDLFHIRFQSRHLVSTNRYSIPGFPALYLGDTTYVCWEEFDRHKFRDLWFVRVETQKDLNIFQIQRIEDFLEEVHKAEMGLQVTYLLRYLFTFPLTLACTIKVLNPEGNFKPEYIIPQLLSEYISRNEKIDGIKFPSTKVDYSLLQKIDAYNYVFPVKKIAKSGYCSVLKGNFHLTQPSSLELEEIIYNPKYHPMILMGDSKDRRQIELIKGQKSSYINTSFGKLEQSFVNREFKQV